MWIHSKAEHTPAHFCKNQSYGNVHRDLHISYTEKKMLKKYVTKEDPGIYLSSAAVSLEYIYDKGF